MIVCPRGDYFLHTNFDFLTSHFFSNFSNQSKGIVVLRSKLKRHFTCDHFSLSYGGLRNANLAI